MELTDRADVIFFSNDIYPKQHLSFIKIKFGFPLHCLKTLYTERINQTSLGMKTKKTYCDEQYLVHSHHTLVWSTTNSGKCSEKLKLNHQSKQNIFSREGQQSWLSYWREKARSIPFAFDQQYRGTWSFLPTRRRFHRDRDGYRDHTWRWSCTCVRKRSCDA